MNVEVRDHDIRIRTEKEIALKLGARYIKDNLYQLPKTIDAVKDLMEYSNNIELSSLYERMNRSRNALLYLKKLPVEMKPLRPYQAQDVLFLSRIPHGAIFNEQRTGKTPTLLSLIKLQGYKKNILIVPAGLVLNWKKECEIWLPGTKVFAIKGPKKQRVKLYQAASEQESYVMIISYDTLKQAEELNNITHTLNVKGLGKPFDSISVDEAHNIRNRKSQRTKAIKEIGKYAEHRYALTGTPAVKNGFDVWSILNFLYPEKFSSYWAFLDRYFEMKRDFFSGTMQPTGAYTRREELEGMLALMGTNRKRKEVMEWLPDKQYTAIPIDLTPKQRKVYEDILETFRYEEDGENKVDAPSVLAQLIRLRQVCLAPSMLGIKAPSAKEEFLLEWLQDHPEPVIIFSQFTSYLKELQKKITENLKEPVVMINGELTSKQKEQSVQDFQSGKARILLANIDAAGTGFCLDAAETTIFLDKHFNPASNMQAEDRMVPISKDRIHKMDVISLVAAETVDEKIETLLQNKFSIVEVINNGGINALDRIFKELKANEKQLQN